MSNKNILDFVAAVATGQSAEAVKFATSEMTERVQAAATAHAQSFQYKVEGPVNGSTSD